MAQRFVSVTASGTGDGSSWANCGSVTSALSIYNAMSAGDELVWESGKEYPAAQLNAGQPFPLTKRVNLRGQSRGGTNGLAIFSDVRTWPWPANGVWTDSGRYTAATIGQNVFNYKDAAAASGGSAIRFLGFRNVGTPIRPLFNASSVLGNLLVEDCRTWNTNGLVYVEVSGDGQCSITANRCRSVGYSEGQFRAFGDLILTDCHGDAQSQFHSPSTNLFGAHVQDAVAGVTTVLYNGQFNRCSYLNHNAAPPAGSSKDPATTGNYMQGDGIVCEENTNFLPSADLVLMNNGDRGIDVKCAIQLGNLVRVYALSNGFDIAAHDDTVETYISDSWLGTTFRASYDSRNSAPLQASGHLHAIRCVMEQRQSNASVYNYVGYGSVQPAHTQAGVTVPQRCGDIKVVNCRANTYTGLSAFYGSKGGSPVVTPTYEPTNLVVTLI